MRTLKQNLMQLKTHIPEKRRGVVDEVLCKECCKTYSGEAKRTLKVRISEPKQTVKVSSRTALLSMLMSLTMALAGMASQ